MPLEKNFLNNKAGADAETLLENDNSKDLKLIEDQSETSEIPTDETEGKAHMEDSK